MSRPLPMPLLQLATLMMTAWLDDSRRRLFAYLLEENRVLREHLGHKPPFTDGQRRRLARAAKGISAKVLRTISPVVTPGTLMTWYRKLVAAKYDGSAKRRAPGRPSTRREIQNLVVDFATANPTWRYTRIRGALLNVGHDVSASTVGRILRRQGIGPAPDRHPSWSQFLATHWDGLAATDFFTVEVLTAFGVVRYQVLFVIRLATRKVEVLGIGHDPGEPWMRNVIRGATDVVDGALAGVRHLIHDRDPLFTAGVRELLASAGLESVRLPARSPNLNAYAERFVGSIRRECLDRVIPLGAGHLRRLVREYVAHYNTERNHQALGNRLIEPEIAANAMGPIRGRQRLGGLLSFYHREAA